jgi:type VI secretion system secreted protein Hcp
MRSKKLIFCLLIIAFAGLLSPADSWAVIAYLRVEDEDGDIPGDSIAQGHEGWIIVASFGHSLIVPTDPNSGLPISPRKHGPIRIVKFVDKASPRLYKALARGAHLREVEIHFIRPGSEGQPEVFYTIFLRPAQITAASPSLIPSNGENQMMEIISFIYNRITWTYEPESIVYEDEWIWGPH